MVKASGQESDQTDLAACDSVNEAGDEFWVQKQTLHRVDCLAWNGPVVYHQLIESW